MKTHLDVGRWGENLAVATLEFAGYQLLSRNWRPPARGRENTVHGELDAVLLDPDQDLVFLEVKTRSSSAYGFPLEAINRSKAQRIKALSYAWCTEHPEIKFRHLRMDAISICGGPTNFSFEHLKAVG